MDPQARMMALAKSFPVLRHKMMEQGDEFTSETALWLWAASAPWSHGERCCAAFILSVWNPTGEWTLPTGHEDRAEGSPAPCQFDLHDAYGVWDLENRQAFLGWAEDPWWP